MFYHEMRHLYNVQTKIFVFFFLENGCKIEITFKMVLTKILILYCCVCMHCSIKEEWSSRMATRNGQCSFFLTLQTTLQRRVLPRSPQWPHSLQRSQQSQSGCYPQSGGQSTPCCSISRGSSSLCHSVFWEHEEFSWCCQGYDLVDLWSFWFGKGLNFEFIVMIKFPFIFHSTCYAAFSKFRVRYIT